MRINALVLIAATLLLSACGFALRGSTGIASTLQPIYVGGSRDSQELQQALRRQLQINQVGTTRKRGQAQLIAEVQLLRYDKRSIALDREARDAEYALFERARLSLFSPQGQLLKGPVVLSRDHHDVSGTDSPYRETSTISCLST